MITLNYLINEQDGISEQGEISWIMKNNKVEILTIYNLILFQTNLLCPNIHSTDDQIKKVEFQAI